MMMELSGKTCAISAVKEDVLAYPVPEGGAIPGELREFTKGMAGRQFSGKSGEAWSATTLGRAGFSRLLLVGVGKADELDLDALRKLGGTAVRYGMSTKSGSVAIFLPKFARIRNADAAQAAAEGAMLASYRFTKFKTKKDDVYELPKAVVVSESGADSVKAGALLANAQNYVRALNEVPANLATPTSIANEAKRLAKEKGFSCKVYGKEEIRKMKMNAFLGVAQGSVQPPALVVLEYGTRGPLLAIVGKGITFDSGGISIKPSKGMQEMKYDKTGALVVLGVFKAASELRLPVRLLGVMPLTENLPSGSAQKPGDIVTAYNGCRGKAGTRGRARIRRRKEARVYDKHSHADRRGAGRARKAVRGSALRRRQARPCAGGIRNQDLRAPVEASAVEGIFRDDEERFR
jgi:leucyl aminopeptidase